MSDNAAPPPTESISDGPQLVTVSPSVLTFTNTTSKVDVCVTNVTADKRILFRVQTTAPTRYVITPSSGFLRPTEMQTVSIQLQADRWHPRHLFIIQAMETDVGETDRRRPWKSAVGTTAPRSIQTVKLSGEKEEKDLSADETQSPTTPSDKRGDGSPHTNSTQTPQSAKEQQLSEKQPLYNALLKKERHLKEARRQRREMELRLETTMRENFSLQRQIGQLKRDNRDPTQRTVSLWETTGPYLAAATVLAIGFALLLISRNTKQIS